MKKKPVKIAQNITPFLTDGVITEWRKVPEHDDNRGPEMLSMAFVVCALSIVWGLIGFVGARWYDRHYMIPKLVVQLDQAKVAVLNVDMDRARHILGVRRGGR